jgi:hypothetical protein
MPTPRQKVQQAILKRKGLETGRYRGLKVVEISKDGNKTLAMRLLEREFGDSIENLLLFGDLAATARYLGIDKSTVSKWRLRLGLREQRAGVLDVS